MASRTLSLFWCVAFGVLSSASAIGQEDDTRKLAEEVAQFFENLNNDDFKTEDVFEELLAGSQLGRKQSKQLQDLLEKYETLETRYGKFLKASELDAQTVGDSLIYLTYLYKTQEFPVVWRFVYYRPPSDEADATDWFIVRLSFDTRIDDLPNLKRSP